MNYQLQLIHSWTAASDSKMERLIKNYYFMYIVSVKQDDIIIINMALQTTVKQKYPGLIFDNWLTWTNK